jgi:exocyst complex component 3
MFSGWFKSGASKDGKSTAGSVILPSLPKMANTVEHCKEEAVKKLAGILSQPDDLYTRLSGLKKRFTSDNIATESQLKSGISEQVSNLDDVLKLTGLIEDMVKMVIQNLDSLEMLCIDADEIIENYDSIKKASIAHQHTNAVRQSYDRFFELNHELERLAELISQEISGAKENMEANHILLIHFYLFHAEQFQFQTQSQVKQLSLGVSSMVENYFQRLKELSMSFQEYFWSLVGKSLDLMLLEHKKDVIVKLVKIIQVEEHMDANIAKMKASNSLFLRQKKNQKSKQSQDSFSMDPLIRPVKNYRATFLSFLGQSIAQRFYKNLKEAKDLASESSDDNTNTSSASHTQDAAQFPTNSTISWANVPVSNLLSGMDFYMQDLLLLQSDMASCFPPSYKIFNFFVTQYHLNIYKVIHNSILSRKELDPLDILALIGWINEYQSSMVDRLGASADWLEPDLLDERIAEYGRKYVEETKLRFKVWFSNLLQQEKSRFKSRDQPPDSDQNGKYISPGVSDLFQIIHDVIGPTLEGSYGQLTVDTISELSRAVSDYIKDYINCIQSEAKKAMEKQNYDRARVEDYTVMTVNSALRLMEHAADLIQELDPSIEPSYKKEIMDSLKTCNDAFFDFYNMTKQILEQFVLFTLKDCIQKLFTESWYKESLIITIVSTLDDYFREFNGCLCEVACESLILQLSESVIIQYLTAMTSKNATFKQTNQDLPNLLKQDRETILRFLTNYQKDDLAKSTGFILERIQGIVSGPKKNIVIEWLALCKDFPDTPMDYIKDLLHKRTDMKDRQSIEAITAQYRSNPRNERIDTPSIFSKMKI